LKSIIVLVIVCFVVILGILMGLEQFVIHQANIAFDEFDTKQKSMPVQSSDIPSFSKP